MIITVYCLTILKNNIIILIGLIVAVLLTYVDEAGVVTLAQVVENAGLVEVGQPRHVLKFLKLGRVHLLC